MKKFLFLAMAAAAMVSCSQNEEIENAAQKAEIKLGTVVKAGTRATVVTNDNFNEFKVSAYIAKDADVTSQGLGTAYIPGALYSGSKAGGWTTTSGSYYWAPGKMQFFAYPSDVTDFNAGATGYPTCTFNIEATAAAQKDIVVAHVVDAEKPASGGDLTLTFKHILTRINFSYKPEQDGYDYTVSEIVIKGVGGGSATYTFNNENNGKGAWGNPGTASVDYKYPINMATTAIDGYYALEGEGAPLMLLPQSVVDKTIEVKYETKKGETVFFSGTKVVTLPANSTWGIGQNIRYKLMLPVGAEEIKLKTEVEEPTEEGSNEYTPATPTTPETPAA